MGNTWNGSHRSPAYFEWWYFHFAAPNKATINMVVHETDIFGLNSRPYLSLSVLTAGEAPRYFRRELDGLPVLQQGQCLQLADLINETKNTISFDVQFPNCGHFTGEITKLSPPLAIQDGILYQDKVTQDSSHWLLSVPHATFTAVIEFEDMCHHLTGVAYHDHQWGTLPIQNFVSDWVWGHFSNEDIALTFFQILTKQGKYIERASMVTQEGGFSGTAVNTNYLTTLFQAQDLNELDSCVTVSFLDELVHLSFEVSPNNLMRSRLNESHQGVTASYLRWSAEAAYQAGRTQHTLYGITEYIRIRSVIHGSFPN